MPASSYDRTPLFTDWRDRYEIVGQDRRRRLGRGLRGRRPRVGARRRPQGHRRARRASPAAWCARSRPPGPSTTPASSPCSTSSPTAGAAFSSGSWCAASRWPSSPASCATTRRCWPRPSSTTPSPTPTPRASCTATSSPQNVMVDGRGVVKVMDFGIARLSGADTLTAEGELLGTVAYMSPEQAAGRRVGPPTDVYSAGVLLYELLAGSNPVRGATAGETVGNILGRPHRPPRTAPPRPAARALRRGGRRLQPRAPSSGPRRPRRPRPCGPWPSA